MELELKDRKALVCGASKGLGYAVAEALLHEGALVMINGRKQDTLEAAARALQGSTGRKPACCAADLTISAERERLYRTTVQELGAVELMLANAGGPPPGPFASHDEDHWKLAIELALGSVTHLCRLALPAMKANRFGRIVQIVSIAGLEALDGLILSNASRPAVLGFAKALAREVARDGVLINSICPGIFMTDRIRELTKQQAADKGITQEQALQSLAGDIPLGRPGEPREVGDLAAFLLSPRNTYITGAAIPIDGAKTRRLI
jgi:3-oxoacyl-[acyl-carrier protein] reductase